MKRFQRVPFHCCLQNAFEIELYNSTTVGGDKEYYEMQNLERSTTADTWTWGYQAILLFTSVSSVMQ